MGIFGWDYPPGCSSVPGDEPGAVSLDDWVPARTPGQAVWWTAGGDVVIDDVVVGHHEWEDEFTDEVNLRRAGAIAQRYLTGG